MAKKALEERIVDAIIGDLEDRKGFDHWWHDIDEDIKDEVIGTLEDKVRKILEFSNRHTGK